MTIRSDLKALALTTRENAIVSAETIQRWLEEVDLSQRTTEVLRELARNLRDASKYLYDHAFDCGLDAGKLVEIDDLLKLDVLRKLLADGVPVVPPPSVNGNAITDGQIRELIGQANADIDHENRWWRDHQHLWTKSGEHTHDRLVADLRNTVEICKSALNPECHAERRIEARARCAEIYNAKKER